MKDTRRIRRNVNPEQSEKRRKLSAERRERLKQNFEWTYYESRYQNFYNAKDGRHKLTVFENKDEPGVWYGLIDCSMIFSGEKARKKEAVLLTHSDPEVMKKVVIRCYVNNTRRGEL